MVPPYSSLETTSAGHIPRFSLPSSFPSPLPYSDTSLSSLSSSGTSFSSDVPNASRSLIITFVTMHTFVWISCIVIMLTVIFNSKSIHRQSTWVNLNLSWIIACFVFAFLLTTGQLITPNPNPDVCLFQAAGVNAVTSLTAGTMLALALQLWFNLHLNTGGRKRRSQIREDIILVSLPYVVPFLEFFATLGYALRNRPEVRLADSGMFCVVANSTLSKISTIYSAILMVPTVAIQCMLGVYLYRNWYRLSSTGSDSGRNGALGIMIRFGLFTAFGVVGTISSVIKIASKGGSSVANILESLPPVSFALIFGFQEDLLRIWMFWRHPRFPRLLPGPARSRIRTRTGLSHLPSLRLTDTAQTQMQSRSLDIELGSTQPQSRPLSAKKASWD